MTVAGLNTRTVVEKYGSLTFVVYTENGADALSKERISLMGFDADINIMTLSERKSVINLSNIVSDIDCDNYVIFNSGAITNPDGQQSAEIVSKKFSVCQEGNCTNPVVSINRDGSDTDYNPRETITFFISTADDTKVYGFDFSAEDVLMYGFSGNVEILQGEGSTKRISISEIAAAPGALEDNMRICIESGVCFDEKGNESAAVCSEPFRISENVRFAYFLISPPSVNFVEDGGEVSFTAKPVSSEAFDYLPEPKVGTIGFNGDVTTTKNGNDYVINVCNVQNTHYTADKAISIAGSIGLQFTGNNYSPIFHMKEDNSPPILSISPPQPKEIKSGGTVQYKVIFADDDDFNVNLSNMLEQKITPVGFEADITVQKNNVNVIIVTFSDVRSTSESSVKRFILEEGAATDGSYNPTLGLSSPSFRIVY